METDQSQDLRNYVVIHNITNDSVNWGPLVQTAIRRNMPIVDADAVLTYLERVMEGDRSQELHHFYRTVFTTDDKELEGLRDYLDERSELGIAYDVFVDGKPQGTVHEEEPYERRPDFEGLDKLLDIK